MFQRAHADAARGWPTRPGSADICRTDRSDDAPDAALKSSRCFRDVYTARAEVAEIGVGLDLPDQRVHCTNMQRILQT